MSNTTRTIKKYPNRRLYDTKTSSYITLADVKKLVLDQVEFRVIDAKSNEDLTRSILLQIILDEESSGSPMFSSDVLTKIIRFYGDAMQGMMGNYLERNVQAFLEMQQRMQEQARSLYGDNPMLNTEAWKQFVRMQTPNMQTLMSGYLERSASVFAEMQQQFQKQAQSMFGNFPFPNFTGSTSSTSNESTESNDADSKDKKRNT